MHCLNLFNQNSKFKNGRTGLQEKVRGPEGDAPSRPLQPWHFFCGVETERRFVNVYLHCIVNNLTQISKICSCPLDTFLRTPVLIISWKIV